VHICCNIAAQTLQLLRAGRQKTGRLLPTRPPHAECAIAAYYGLPVSRNRRCYPEVSETLLDNHPRASASNTEPLPFPQRNYRWGTNNVFAFHAK